MVSAPQTRWMIYLAVASLPLLLGGILVALLGEAAFPPPCCGHTDPWWLLFRGTVWISLIAGLVSFGATARFFQRRHGTRRITSNVCLELAASTTLITAAMLLFWPAVENAFVIWVMTRPSPTTGVVGKVSLPDGPTQAFPLIDGGGVSNGTLSMRNGCFSLIKHSARNFGIQAYGYPPFSEPIGDGYFYASVDFGPAGPASVPAVKVVRISLLRYAIQTIACNRSDAIDAIEVVLQGMIQNGKPYVDLSTAGPANWERLCVMAPRTNSEMAGRILGFAWDVDKLFPEARSDERIQVLAFLKGKQVIAAIEHARGRGDLASLEGQCIPRTDSKLAVKKDSNGRLLLVRPEPAAHE